MSLGTSATHHIDVSAEVVTKVSDRNVTALNYLDNFRKSYTGVLLPFAFVIKHFYGRMASAQSDVQLQDFANIFSLKGKVAVVSGGSRGLGLHAASGYLVSS